MNDQYSHINLANVEDAATKFGVGESQEARFANRDLDTEQTGLSYHHVKPHKRQAFAHKHVQAEEVYVVLDGSGWVKLNDKTLKLTKLDAIRVAPKVTRQFEAGPEGLWLLAFGPLNVEDRGEVINDWWTTGSDTSPSID